MYAGVSPMERLEPHVRRLHKGDVPDGRGFQWTADEDLEVCMFFACDAGGASVNCPTDMEATSPDGLEGCCGVGSVEPDFFCTGIDNNGQMRLRVGGLETQGCVDYELAYRFL